MITHSIPQARQRLLQEKVLQLALLPKTQGSVPGQPVWTPRYNCPVTVK
jgi:hypothetical protein